MDPKLVRLADIESQPVDWLMYPYIAFGKITSLEGDPGEGKSTIALAIAASVSIGRGFPVPVQLEPQYVLIASAEDGLSDTVRPRLEKMGADLTRIHAIEDGMVIYEKGFSKLEEYLTLLDAALVILDPLVAFIGSKVDIHRANETRTLMAQLAEIAAKYNTAILIIRHLTKTAQVKSIYRAQGNIDITAACRSVLLAGHNDQDPEERAIFHIKSNLAPHGPTLGYRLVEGGLKWTGESNLSIERILTTIPEEDANSLTEAIDFLLDELQDGPINANQIFKDANDLRIHERTLKRAKKKLCIVTTRKGESGKRGGGKYIWSLPENPLDDLECQVYKRGKFGTLNHFSFENSESSKNFGPLNTSGNTHEEGV